jgi:succinate dehydrogenase/fumarate reductase iron-sulfur protein
MNLPNENSETYHFEILRYDEASGVPPHFQTLDVPLATDVSLLDALFEIQDKHDPSLSFRYSCRGLVCGSCGMVANGQLTLACRTRLAELNSRRIVLEPLPGFDVIKDLVVDMDPFWEKYAAVEPWLHAEDGQPEETRMSERQRDRIDQFANCILCGLCYSACPARKFNDHFTGPAALAKLYRFVGDSRESRSLSELRPQNDHAGAWGCRTATRCIEACPKQVRPFDGIAGLRRHLVAKTMLSLLRGGRDAK